MVAIIAVDLYALPNGKPSSLSLKKGSPGSGIMELFISEYFYKLICDR